MQSLALDTNDLRPYTTQTNSKTLALAIKEALDDARPNLSHKEVMHNLEKVLDEIKKSN